MLVTMVKSRLIPSIPQLQIDNQHTKTKFSKFMMKMVVLIMREMMVMMMMLLLLLLMIMMMKIMR